MKIEGKKHRKHRLKRAQNSSITSSRHHQPAGLHGITMPSRNSTNQTAKTVSSPSSARAPGHQLQLSSPSISVPHEQLQQHFTDPGLQSTALMQQSISKVFHSNCSAETVQFRSSFRQFHSSPVYLLQPVFTVQASSNCPASRAQCNFTDLGPQPSVFNAHPGLQAASSTTPVHSPVIHGSRKASVYNQFRQSSPPASRV